MSSTPLNVIENNMTPKVNKKKELAASAISLIITGVVMLAAVLLLRTYIMKPFIVNGVSMYPTYDTWHYLLIDRATYNFLRDPERGEVIVFRSPMDTSRFFIKRIVGLPGETVTINGHIVTIEKNDAAGGTLTLDEPYIIDTKRKEAQINITLGSDEYYMLGDNRLESADSRYWGALKRDDIAGRSLLRLFPLNKIDWLPGDYNYSN